MPKPPAADADGKVGRDLAEVLNKGTGKDVGLRITAALMLLQKHGIEVPGAIWNFNRCQMRLGGTVDAMNMLLEKISAEMSRLSPPQFEYEAPEGECASALLFSAVSGFGPGRVRDGGGVLPLHGRYAAFVGILWYNRRKRSLRSGIDQWRMQLLT